MKGFLIGHANNVFRVKETIEKEAKRRLLICNSCPLKKVKLGVTVCGNCGCPLQALVRQNQKICSRWR